VKDRADERRFKRFVGVDLGGGKGKKTALAILDVGEGGGVTVTRLAPRAGGAPLYDAALIETIKGAGEDVVVCVDAPLTLPPCLRCDVPVCPGQESCSDPAVLEMNRLFGPVDDESRDHRRGKPPLTPYTQRATEVYLHKQRGVLPRETLGQGMGPLTARAAHLVRALADRFTLNHNLLEVYPRATLELLGYPEPYKKRVDRRIEILALLPELTFGPGVWREECRKSDHVFDAVICAYTGYLWARDGWSVPQSSSEVLPRDGWIWVPPEREVAAVEPAADDELPPQQRKTLP
jgi:predicted nuclease with RNAse H fold